MMKVNTWITGIHLMEYETDMPDFTKLGFDSDFGDMYAWKGKLVDESTILRSLFKKKYRKHTKKVTIKPTATQATQVRLVCRNTLGEAIRKHIRRPQINRL